MMDFYVMHCKQLKIKPQMRNFIYLVLNNANYVGKKWLFLTFFMSLINGCSLTTKPITTEPITTEPITSKELRLGGEQMSQYYPDLKNKRVGLIVNQTSVLYPNTPKATHIVDALLADKINVVKVFAPEHGFRGDRGAGESIDDNIDSPTGLPIISLYGKNKAPNAQMLSDIDVLIFDIQDVGVRFYTYISTMHYAMQAAAQYHIPFIVLDRPNPNGHYTAGPILDLSLQSFVGMHPIPIVHGLTVGELAKMIKGEKWIETAEQLDLRVIPVQGYRKSMSYPLPIAPSPNLPNAQAVQWYASLCLFEPTHISVGRGTEHPFQMLGHPQLSISAQPISVTPISMPTSAPYPKWENTPLQAILIEQYQPDLAGFDISLLVSIFALADEQQIELITAPDFFDQLAGTTTLRTDLQAGKTVSEIIEQWRQPLAHYRQLRLPYLLYPAE
jgi:uncharacterized protein YbbC (DUF1343 family)